MKEAPIYSFPEIKEPEKKSAWSEMDQELAKSQPLFRDFERDRAIKRTELIKAKMSPPGGLGLPPLLETQRLKYGITDAFFKSQACFDRIFVFPIDPFDGDDRLAGSTFLVRPTQTKMKDLQEGHRGVLISAGLTAADRLMSHGIELGHIVTTNKNVPFARRCDSLEKEDMFYLVMRDADLAGSETLAEQIMKGDKRMVDVGGEGFYSHQIGRVLEDGSVDTRKKQSVYVNDTW